MKGRLTKQESKKKRRKTRSRRSLGLSLHDNLKVCNASKGQSDLGAFV